MAAQLIKNNFHRIGFHAVLAIITSLALAACGNSEPSAQAQQAMPAMPVSVITAEATSVPIRVEAVAQTEGAKEVEIRPRVGGILLKKLFEEGAPIKAGQAMFLIDPEPYRIALTNAQGELVHRNARLTQTSREAARLKELLATQSISQREYDNATSDSAMASADTMQAQAAVREAQLNLSYTTVTAPASGMAGRFLFSEGALVAPNASLLTTIVQTSPIWVRFSLSESELKALGGSMTEQNAQKVSLILTDGSEYGESGKLNFAASQIDPAFGTQQLRAEFANANKQLLPGQFVRASVTTGTREGVFLLPQTAVLTGDQGKFVYVAEKNKAGQTVAGVRPIEEGGWQGKDWIVLNGLQVGEQVIVDNLIKVRPGAEVAPHPLGLPPVAPAPNKSAAH
ncbi:MAG: efflux RND transporter periplasmic adaptor subunit [Methylophilaceae bacterium]